MNPFGISPPSKRVWVDTQVLLCCKTILFMNFGGIKLWVKTKSIRNVSESVVELKSIYVSVGYSDRGLDYM